jgi:hypothetical protein
MASVANVIVLILILINRSLGSLLHFLRKKTTEECERLLERAIGKLFQKSTRCFITTSNQTCLVNISKQMSSGLLLLQPFKRDHVEESSTETCENLCTTYR